MRLKLSLKVSFHCLYFTANFAMTTQKYIFPLQYVYIFSHLHIYIDVQEKVCEQKCLTKKICYLTINFIIKKGKKLRVFKF